jgi:hypothetical protein
MGAWGFGLFQNDAAQDFLATLPARTNFSSARIRRTLTAFLEKEKVAVGGRLREELSPEVFPSLMELWQSGTMPWLEKAGLFERDAATGEIRVVRNYLETSLYESYDETLAACAVLAAGIQSLHSVGGRTDCSQLRVSRGGFGEDAVDLIVRVPKNQIADAEALRASAVHVCNVALADASYASTFDNVQDHSAWSSEVRNVTCVLDS